MFLLAPLLIAAIIYYTAVDILIPRKKRDWRKDSDARNRAIGERIGHEVDGG